MKNLKFRIATFTLIFVCVLISCDNENKELDIPISLSLELVSGDKQQTEVGWRLVDSIIVIVKDQNSNAHVGATINYIVTEGLVSKSVVTTDENGEAKVSWTLGYTEGEQILTITAYKEDDITPLKGSPILVKAIATPIPSTLTDNENNLYKIIEIGNQVWMAENLKSTKFNNSEDIPIVIDSDNWESLSTPAYCWYNNETSYKDIYGALYNYYTIETGKLCPTGWHVPSDAEWTNLTNFLGGEIVAGGKLKESGITHWKSPNTGASNSSGFTGLPGGSRSDLFHGLGDDARWWSATEYNSLNAWSLSLYYTYNGVFRYNYVKNFGYSVRCVRD